MTIEMFKAYWQKVSPDLLSLSFPGTKAGDEASYTEWSDEGGNKCYGMREPDGAKHGIVRTIYVDGDWIREATYCEDKPHGLSFVWRKYLVAFEAAIYDHGQAKAGICWKDDWSEYHSSGNKELILENDGLNIFKP